MRSAQGRQLLAALLLTAGVPLLREPPAAHGTVSPPQVTPRQAPAVQAGPADRAQAIARVRESLDRESRAGRFSGTVLIAERGRVVLAAAYGLANRETGTPNAIDTPFNICSMGKMLTAFAVMRLADEGRIDVRAPISRYLLDFPAPYASRITVHHLLSHTSGLGNYMARPDFERRAASLTTIESRYRLVCEETPAFEPGARFSYSNSGFIALGRIIEVVTGQSYAGAMRQLVLEPIGMKHTAFLLVNDLPANAARGYVRTERDGFVREPAVIPPPGSDGGVHSTVGDLLLFDRELHHGRLLTEGARRLMMTPNLNGYGYGLSIKPPEEDVSRRTSIGHTGGLIDRSTVLRHFMDDDVTMIVLSNVSSGAIDAAREIERLFFGVAPGAWEGTAMS